MIWGLLIYVFNFWNFRGSFWSLIFGFWKFLKCILNQNSYFWGGVCFMNFLIWGFLNDFINSSGIIFEFHYNFIIFFCVWVPRFYTKKFQFLFTPYTPQKMTILAKFGHFGTFWYFLDFFWPPIPPQKNKKNTILAQFCHFGIFWHFWDFFYPV